MSRPPRVSGALERAGCASSESVTLPVVDRDFSACYRSPDATAARLSAELGELDSFRCRDWRLGSLQQRHQAVLFVVVGCLGAHDGD